MAVSLYNRPTSIQNNRENAKICTGCARAADARTPLKINALFSTRRARAFPSTRGRAQVAVRDPRSKDRPPPPPWRAAFAHLRSACTRTWRRAPIAHARFPPPRRHRCTAAAWRAASSTLRATSAAAASATGAAAAARRGRASSPTAYAAQIKRSHSRSAETAVRTRFTLLAPGLKRQRHRGKGRAGAQRTAECVCAVHFKYNNVARSAFVLGSLAHLQDFEPPHTHPHTPHTHPVSAYAAKREADVVRLDGSPLLWRRMQRFTSTLSPATRRARPAAAVRG